MDNVPPAEPDPSSAARDVTPRLANGTGDAAPGGRRRALVFGCNEPVTLPNRQRYAEDDARDVATALEAAKWTLEHPPLLGEAVTKASVE